VNVGLKINFKTIATEKVGHSVYICYKVDKTTLCSKIVTPKFKSLYGISYEN